MRLKKALNAAVGSAGQINQQIEKVPAWDWAKNAQNQGRLQQYTDAVNAAMSPFMCRFLTEDVSKLKKEVDDKFFVSEIEGFLAAKTKVNDLQEFSSRLMKRHAD